jgi:hypothetical protein
MRGEIMNLEETKVRAIRKTVAMRLRLAAYDAALLQVCVCVCARVRVSMRLRLAAYNAALLQVCVY